MRAQRSALAIAELREIDDVRHDRCRQSEFAEDIDEVAGGNDNLIDARENERGRAEALEVVAGFATAVVDQALAAAQFCEEPGGRGREQERPVGRGEDVGNVDVFEAAPEMPEVDGLAQNCAQAGNAFRPGEGAGQRRIDGEEADVDVGIVLPEPQEQVGLDGLSADITQAGRDDGDSQALASWRAACRGFGGTGAFSVDSCGGAHASARFCWRRVT